MLISWRILELSKEVFCFQKYKFKLEQEWLVTGMLLLSCFINYLPNVILFTFKLTWFCSRITIPSSIQYNWKIFFTTRILTLVPFHNSTSQSRCSLCFLSSNIFHFSFFSGHFKKHLTLIVKMGSNITMNYDKRNWKQK